MKLNKDLLEFVALLNAHQVDYLIVGGHAVAFHGYPRLTIDVDIWLRPSPTNAARALAALHDFGFSETGVTVDDLQRPEAVLQMGLPPNRIDLLPSISGVTFEEAWPGVPADLDGVSVHMIGRDALLKNKRASARAKDLADLEALSAVASAKR